MWLYINIWMYILSILYIFVFILRLLLLLVLYNNFFLVCIILETIQVMNNDKVISKSLCSLSLGALLPLLSSPWQHLWISPTLWMPCKSSGSTSSWTGRQPRGNKLITNRFITTFGQENYFWCKNIDSPNKNEL